MTERNPRELLVSRRLNPLLSTLPEKFQKFEPHQIEAVDRVIRAFDRGARAVVLDAPTGTGKTLIGESVRRILKSRAVYMCSDKGLQSQFKRDFDYGQVLMGRANYPTLRFADSFHPGQWMGHISCDDCTWDAESDSCALCDSKRACPYERAKATALQADLAILNTAYFLTECNGPGRFKGRGLVIADEADLLESALMGYVSVEVSKRRMERYGWGTPKLTVEGDWLRWCEEKLAEIPELRRKARGEENEIRRAKEVKYLAGLAENLRRVKTDLAGGESPWVYDGDRERVSFKPSRVVLFGEEKLWGHGARWLLMSASIISADEMMWSLGFREGEYESVVVGSTFPVKNRQVRVLGTADMRRKVLGKQDGELIASIRRILFRRPSDRILIHTVSYALTRKVAETLRAIFPNRGIFAYYGPTDRTAALNKYRSTTASVLCGPSLDRGVDLPGDLCRVQIICKVPFPNLGDKVVSARYHSGSEGKTWYTVQTVRTLVQMTGRAVRSKDDWAETWILDKSFQGSLWDGGGRRLFPEWWREALVWERNGN